MNNKNKWENEGEKNFFRVQSESSVSPGGQTFDIVCRSYNRTYKKKVYNILNFEMNSNYNFILN